MKKNNLRKKTNLKTLKAGGLSLAICAIVLVAVILVNLIVSALPSKFTEYDISANDLYTIGEYSEQVVKGIDTDVTIYHLATDANIDDGLTSLLRRYSDVNNCIKVEVRDPELTQIASQYSDEALSENSLIFVSDKRSKVVDAAEIYEYSEEMQQYMYYGYSVSPDIFDGESEITGALDFVTTDILPVVYNLSGHGEYVLTDSVVSELSSQNIQLNELDLVLEKTVPEDCECLIIMSPEIDISEKELDAILEYLSLGGRIFITTLVGDNEKPTPNFDLLLEEYGIQREDGMIIEADQNKYYYSANYLMPTVESHEITNPIIDSGYYTFFPIAESLASLPSIRSSVELSPLFVTSDKAFRRTNLTNSSQEKSEDDIGGQFTIGYAITETVGYEEMRGVIVSTPYFLDEGFSSFTGNINVFLNSIKWMCDLDEKISVVDSKSFSSGGTLEISEANGLLMAAVITIVVPVILLIIGIVIFARRKKS